MQMPPHYQRHKTEICAQCQISLNKHLGWVIILLLLWYVTPENTWKKDGGNNTWTQADTCMYSCFYTLRCKTLSANPISHSSSCGTPTSNKQLFEWTVTRCCSFPPPSVFCLPGTLIGSMQSNVTNWIILALELEAADRRSRERCAQSGSYTLSGVTLDSFCSGLLWDFTPRYPRD